MDDKTNDGEVRRRYVIIAGILIAASVLIAALLQPLKDVKLEPVDGISVFAVLYVLAQAIERVTQLLVPGLDRIVGSGKTASLRKAAALTAIREASVQIRTGISVSGIAFASSGAAVEEVAKKADDGDKELTAANVEKAWLTNAVAFVFAATAVSLFNFSLLASIGFTNVPDAVDHIVTATAIMGGSTGLADLISKLQKSKTDDEKKA